jgi:diaminopimelate epimerase
MRVWERGSGETLACGTGACASAFATMKRGLCETTVRVHLLGGDLDISLVDDEIYMRGKAEYVFTGEINF